MAMVSAWKRKWTLHAFKGKQNWKLNRHTIESGRISPREGLL